MTCVEEDELDELLAAAVLVADAAEVCSASGSKFGGLVLSGEMVNAS